MLVVDEQEYIVQLCIDAGDSGKGKGKLGKGKLSKAKGSLGDDSHPGEEDELGTEQLDVLTVDDHHEDVTAGDLVDATLEDDLHNRKLLRGVVRVLLASAGGGGVCPDGDEPFWSIRAIHETHIFIFVLAVVHIIFSGLSVLLCSWKVGADVVGEQGDCHHLIPTASTPKLPTHCSHVALMMKCGVFSWILCATNGIVFPGPETTEMLR